MATKQSDKFQNVEEKAASLENFSVEDELKRLTSEPSTFYVGVFVLGAMYINVAATTC